MNPVIPVTNMWFDRPKFLLMAEFPCSTALKQVMRKTMKRMK
jgi:hypothetical protein